MRRDAAVVMVALGAACGGAEDPPATTTTTTYPATENWTRDIVATALDVSLATMGASAAITLGPSATEGASLEASGIRVDAVNDTAGPIAWKVGADGHLDVGAPPSDGEIQIVVDYTLTVRDDKGVLRGGTTLTWPYDCGYLFPCKSRPDDGLTFALSVHDAPQGQSLVYPSRIDTPTASYVAAWALGSYTELQLGTTSAGTRLSAWYLPGGNAAATTGTADLVAFFEFYERLLGPYPFGDHAGSVAAGWAGGALGGMEHHPYWHVATMSMNDDGVHAHEAAHGWYGDGVRIACWEDFVLSEGTVSYLTARAIEDVQGSAAGTNAWSAYQQRLDAAMASVPMKIAWPDSCGVVDIIDDGLFSSIPYMKGAFFFRALEQRIGRAALDAALASFFNENVGMARTMQQLVEHIAASSGYDPAECANDWLRVEAVPMAATCP